MPTKSNKAIGYDKIPPVVFKPNIGNWAIITYGFLALININKGNIPNCWGAGVITFIRKEGDKSIK